MLKSFLEKENDTKKRWPPWQSIRATLTFEPDLLGKHSLNKKLSSHGNTPPYQNSMQLVHLIREVQARTWFPGPLCDLWPWSPRGLKNGPLIVMHYNTNIHSSCPRNQSNTGQNMVFKTFMWPLTFNSDLLGEHLLDKKWSTHGYTPPCQNSFKLMYSSPRYRPNKLTRLCV